MVGVVNKYMSNPGNNIRKQQSVFERYCRLRYLRGTVDSALCFRQSNLGLQHYVNANMVGDINDRKGTIGYVYTLGGKIVSWFLNGIRLLYFQLLR